MDRGISDGLREYRLRAELLRSSLGKTSPGEFSRLQRRAGHDRPWPVALRKCQPGEPNLPGIQSAHHGHGRVERPLPCAITRLDAKLLSGILAPPRARCLYYYALGTPSSRC